MGTLITKKLNTSGAFHQLKCRENIERPNWANRLAKGSVVLVVDKRNANCIGVFLSPMKMLANLNDLKPDDKLLNMCTQLRKSGPS